MNNIIRQLSQIEADTVQILEQGTARKKELASEYEEKARQFDAALERETADRIAALKASMEKSMEHQLESQKKAAEDAVRRLESHYESRHRRYTDLLFQKITEV